jgi:hypothetical protein
VALPRRCSLSSKKEKEFIRYFREGQKLFIVRRDDNRFDPFLEVEVYAMGGWRGRVLVPEGCEARGWHRFVTELCKVKAFFESSFGSFFVMLRSPYGASLSMGKKAGSGLGMEPEKTGGKGTFREVHLLMFAEVVCLVVSPCALEEGSLVRLGDPLVKNLFDMEGTLGQKSIAREIVACLFSDVDDGVGLQR